MKLPPDKVRRIVYMGTPALAVPPLVALHQAGYEIPLVVSQPDVRRGRGGASSPSPVKQAAIDLGLKTTDNVDDALSVDADMGVVVAFGRLIKPHVLDKLALVNMHFSLLPRWRGAAPVERAILAGDDTTGVCLMVLDEELDVGDVYRVVEIPMPPDATVESLRSTLVELGTGLLLSALNEGFGTPVPQRGEVTWAPKISPDELELDWEGSAEVLERTVRLGNAWTTVDGRRLKIWQVRPSSVAGLAPGQLAGTVVGTTTGALELVEVQPEGKARRSAGDWVNGVRLGPHDRLGG